MKIAILTPTFAPFSGIDKIVEHQETELSRQGHEVTIFCLEAQMRPRHAKLVELGMPKSLLLQRLYRLFFFMDFVKIDRAVRMLKGYDLMICHLYPMTLIATEARKRYRIKYTYYNAGVAEPAAFSSLAERAYMRLFTYLTNESVSNADSAVSISRYLQGKLKRETGLNSTVEHVFVDKKRFNKRNSGAAIRRKYKLGRSPVMLYVGRLSPHKGVHILLKVYKLVKEHVPDVKLIVAGKATFPAYSRELRKLADRDVIFTGFVPEKDFPELYAACDVYTTCTLWEGFDIPIVEANLTGKPAVAFDIGAHPEVLRKGRLVRKGDTDAFTKAVVSYLKK